MLKKARPVTFTFDERSEITPDDVWSAFVGYEYGPGLRMALSVIASIPVEALVKAVCEINRVESIGRSHHRQLMIVIRQLTRR